MTYKTSTLFASVTLYSQNYPHFTLDVEWLYIRNMTSEVVVCRQLV